MYHQTPLSLSNINSIPIYMSGLYSLPLIFRAILCATGLDSEGGGISRQPAAKVARVFLQGGHLFAKDASLKFLSPPFTPFPSSCYSCLHRSGHNIRVCVCLGRPATFRVFSLISQKAAARGGLLVLERDQNMKGRARVCSFLLLTGRTSQRRGFILFSLQGY